MFNPYKFARLNLFAPISSLCSLSAVLCLLFKWFYVCMFDPTPNLPNPSYVLHAAWHVSYREDASTRTARMVWLTAWLCSWQTKLRCRWSVQPTKRTEAIVFISTPVIRAGHGIATHLSWSVAIPCPLAGLARYTMTQVYRVAHVLVFYISNPYEWTQSPPCAWLVGQITDILIFFAKSNATPKVTPFLLSWLPCPVVNIFDVHAWFHNPSWARQWVDQLVVQEDMVVLGPVWGGFPDALLPSPRLIHHILLIYLIH